MKVCTKCGIEKELDKFINDYRLKSGKGSKCKTCVSDYMHKRHVLKLGPPKTAQQKAKMREYSKEWSKKNRHKKRLYYRKGSANNREADRLRGHERRLKARSNSFRITKKEMKKLYRQPCFICGSRERIEADHIIPISKGGRHSVGNLLALCRNCNAKKSDKPLVYLRYKKT
jgi:5-methylcytosine-specific restriction endonuclease McrA